MGLKTGLVVGFAVGYYLGAKAGRERYEQIRELLGEIGDSETLDNVQAALELGIDRVIGGGGDEYTVRTTGASTPPVGNVVQDSSR